MYVKKIIIIYGGSVRRCGLSPFKAIVVISLSRYLGNKENNRAFGGVSTVNGEFGGAASSSPRFCRQYKYK